jgi:hypothetical protein
MERASKSEPPSCLAIFMIGQDSRGNWGVRDQSGLHGGLFVGRAEALRYVRDEAGIIREPSSWSTELSSSIRAARDGRQCCNSIAWMDGTSAESRKGRLPVNRVRSPPNLQTFGYAPALPTPFGENDARSGSLISKPAITGAQLRAARAFLKWSVRELSDRCRISRSAISRGEKFDGTPPMHVRNLDAIRRTFEEHGIEFLGLDGVRLLPSPPKNYR